MIALRIVGSDCLQKLAAGVVVILTLGAAMATQEAAATEADDAAAVVALDVEYQAAVERGDVKAMDRILAADFVLVTGAGNRFTKSDLLEEARAQRTVYEKQHASERTVKVWGDTAVVTALLHARGTQQGKSFEYRVWYSDTYVRMKGEWRYVFGQSSLPLPQRP